ncbi:MAG: CocE/NonD family hydrolase [Saprospiraceae bacterium]|nr:CocE/NonD family hydrolase [Saprospiraceae bacterium]
MKKILVYFLVFVVGVMDAQSPITMEIPMRDGKMLAGDLYLPSATSRFPTLFVFTPYGKFFYSLNGLPLGIDKIADSDYAIVIVDWRCRFASLSACATGSTNGEDGYDVIEWIAEQPWSNGKVGMYGPSALGNVQFQTAREQPPSLVACVPEVAAPHFSYDQYYQGGILKLASVQTLDLLFGFVGPIVNSPYFNFFWEIAENGSMYPERIDIPMLLVGGWFDHNVDQLVRFTDTLYSSSQEMVRDQHRTLIGPWVHGGAGQANVGSAVQGDLFFPEAEGFNTEFALEFFNYHLREQDNGWNNRARITYFQMGEDAWVESVSWPPSAAERQHYFLHSDMGIRKEPPPETGAHVSFTYNPEDPSPTVGGKTLNLSLVQGPLDQRELVEARDDALIFSTEALSENLAVVGKIDVKLFVSSNRPDTDFAVRITDVYPDGRSILLLDDIQRMRFRNGFTTRDTAFMEPDEVYNITLTLDDIAHTFGPGHRLRLIITSSNYPQYNRNMNTGGQMHPDGNMDTLVHALVARNSVFMESQAASALILPILSNPTVYVFNHSTQILNVSPNPARDQISISGLPKERVTMQLHDARGMHIGSISTAGFDEENIDISFLPKGLYVLQVVSKSSYYLAKFMVY